MLTTPGDPQMTVNFRSLARRAALVLALPFWALPGMTQAQTGPAAVDLRAAGYLAANCANCHGTQGRSQSSLASLAGMPAAALGQSMRDFRDGKRPATLMHQLAKGYTDEQIDAMAAYFAAQKAK